MKFGIPGAAPTAPVAHDTPRSPRRRGPTAQPAVVAALSGSGTGAGSRCAGRRLGSRVPGSRRLQQIGPHRGARDATWHSTLVRRATQRCTSLLCRPRMTSIVAILDLKGKPLIQRAYRDDVDPSALERFLPLLLEVEEEHGPGAVHPCMSSGGINYMHVRHNNLYLLALSRRNSNAAEVLLFLHKLAAVLEEYFKQLEEESIRDLSLIHI